MKICKLFNTKRSFITPIAYVKMPNDSDHSAAMQLVEKELLIDINMTQLLNIEYGEKIQEGIPVFILKQ